MDSGGRRTSALTLRLQRALPAAPATVFDACVDPEQLAEWWGPAGFTSPSVELDVWVGGHYRIAMQPPEGELFHLRGEFLVVDRPRRLAYTFEWEEPDPDDQETTVTLTFVDTADSTELSLQQAPCATEARHALHEGGWTEGLARLEAHLRRRARGS